MNVKNLILPLVLTLASTPIYAGHGNNKHQRDFEGEVVKARVSHVEPIIEVVRVPQKQRECWDEVVTNERARPSSRGLITGAIIGGVIGHNVGNEHNRGATAAVGTLIGATIGHDADLHKVARRSHTEHHCSVTTGYVEEEQILGYRVSYHYHGDTYTTRMDHEPGRFVRLRVTHQLLD